ncbi:RNA-binding protein 34 [Austrofundulus limnaeus]|uniref:RNA-binding protein 34 n=1 Tax=Austrofundulus limnaeus TaxID=52670 RepID=A0A2I4CV89_AUSLI|nr:PREDICTED: RNA-binding protein 34 [Austrofundulus limnaeus]
MAMKKKAVHSSVSVPGGEPSPRSQSAHYTVGQVSGSLSQQDSVASGCLSALFRTSAQAAPLLFQPAAKVVTKKEDEKERNYQVKEEQSPKKNKKLLRKRSASNQQVQNRESSLQNADDEEKQCQSSVKKRKRREESEAGREKDVEHWVMKRQTLKARKHQEALKNKRTIFVGNLPVSYTEKTLRSLFKNEGPIESIRFRSVVREDPSMSRKLAAIKRKIHPQKQSINAYVLFKNEDAVTKALESNGLEVEKDFHIRVDRVTESSSHDNKRSVFVGNLPFEIKESVFRQHFEECGTVEAVRLVRDKNSGLGKGFGYVLFESADSVQLALELDGSKLQGRSIRVKRSVKKEKQKNKTDNRGTSRKPNKPFRNSPGQEKGPGPGGLKSPRRFRGKQQTSGKSHASFKGEMVDPKKKPKKKGVKKAKAKKLVHL